jgi:hypothetical protein
MIIPAIIDSHGNPGIPGSTNGVVVEDEVVTVSVTTAVVLTIDVETDVLVSVVALVAVTVLASEEVELLELVDTIVEPVLVCVKLFSVVVCWPTTGGFKGSR